MADDVSLNVVVAPLRAALGDMNKRVDRATRWALREAGRQTKREARKRARVYQGPRADVPKGRLRASIKTSRQMPELAGQYSLRVGPRGWPAVGYAGRVEDLDHYMSGAYETVVGRLAAIHAGAWSRSMAKR